MADLGSGGSAPSVAGPGDVPAAGRPSRGRTAAAALVVLLLLAGAGAGVYVAVRKPAPRPAAAPVAPARAPMESVVAENWDDPAGWVPNQDDKGSKVEIAAADGGHDRGLAVRYDLAGDGGWIEAKHAVSGPAAADVPVVFLVKAEGPGDLEIKWLDADGSVFWRKTPLASYKDWTQVVVYRRNLEYAWGGDTVLGDLATFTLAVSGKGSGALLLDEVGYGPAGLEPSFPTAGPDIDPNAELEGISFEARRDSAMTPEDTGVLEWLKACQDAFSPESALVPSMEDNQGQTFNNALVAMAFIVKGERARAERILDFYQASMVRENRCGAIQNFYLRGEARGFYQHVEMRGEGERAAYHIPGKPDRWMGDMAWLLLACKHHEKAFKSARYAPLAGALKTLLVSWYTDAPDGPGGYVRHGWRQGDHHLHEAGGHPEGNIDAYAVFRLVGEAARAAKIRTWLERVATGPNQPLDHYTWRAMAYGGAAAAELLRVPDFDLRYRKVLEVNGRRAAGVYPFANGEVTNAWLDGTGHMACAFFAAGDVERGNFYANQYDAFLVDRTVNGVPCRGVPYTANTTGEFPWVRTERGFASTAAWYIFAKNRFNPFTLERR